MSYGYSIRVVEAIKNADVNHLGVQLGLACIANDISVSEAARALGITRQTSTTGSLAVSNRKTQPPE
jgi:hypothetical protein